MSRCDKSPIVKKRFTKAITEVLKTMMNSETTVG